MKCKKCIWYDTNTDTCLNPICYRSYDDVGPEDGYEAGSPMIENYTYIEASKQNIETKTNMSPFTFGKWERVYGYVTPGGDPVYRCARCHGSEHIHGAEHPKRMMVCKECWSVNSYPFEKTYEQNE